MATEKRKAVGLMVRLTPESHRALRLLAVAESTSLNKLIQRAVDRYLEGGGVSDLERFLDRITIFGQPVRREPARGQTTGR